MQEVWDVTQEQQMRSHAPGVGGVVVDVEATGVVVGAAAGSAAAAPSGVSPWTETPFARHAGQLFLPCWSHLRVAVSITTPRMSK